MALGAMLAGLLCARAVHGLADGGGRIQKFEPEGVICSQALTHTLTHKAVG